MWFKNQDLLKSNPNPISHFITQQYINPELYQLKKYNPKGFNNRRGGGRPFGNGGFKRNNYGQGQKTGGYGKPYENGSGGGYQKKTYENNGYNNGAGTSKYGERKMNSHTRFDDRGAPPTTAYSNGGSRFQ